MNELKLDIRLGIVALWFLVDFDDWLLDQMEQETWVREIKLEFQTCSVG